MDEETTKPAPSRRKMLGAGALGAGALAFGGLSLDQALADGGPGSTEGSPFGGLVDPEALPPVIPGTRTAVVAFSEPTAFRTDGVATNPSWNNGFWLINGGIFDAVLPVEPGSTIVRIDLYVRRAASGNVSMSILRADPSGGGSGASVGSITTATGTGVLQGSYTTPIVLGAGDKIYLEGGSFSTNAITFCGVIVTYYDAKPQLNLLNTPIRVYDSRPGSPPAGGVKAPLANGATRGIDMTVGGAVPVGAKAALISLTVVQTSPAGFLAVFKGGVGWPGNSSINWDHAGQVTAATTVSAVSASAVMNVYANLGCSTDFLVDVIGYYA